jgi:hypothetical protein
MFNRENLEESKKYMKNKACLDDWLQFNKFLQYLDDAEDLLILFKSKSSTLLLKDFLQIVHAITGII